MQRHDHESVFAQAIPDPAHAMNGRLMRQPDRLPPLGPISRGQQIKNGPAVYRVAGIPTRAHGHLGLAISIDIEGGDANVVQRGEVLGHHMFFPARVFIPNDLVLVGQQHVGLLIAVHVRHRHAVANLDVGVNLDRPERQPGRLGRKQARCSADDKKDCQY